jgi:mercuric ion transport protein
MSKGTVSLSILSSVGASICCIAPMLAMFSGVSGIASTVSWIEPARPYLIGFSVVSLGFAWYQKLRLQKKNNCGCESPKKQTLYQSTGFLSAITILAVLLMTFRSYSHVFYPKKESVVASSTISSTPVTQVEFTVKGMGCSDCEPEVETEVGKLSGIRFVKASCVKKNTVVTFDSTKTSIQAIWEAINKTGYTVQSAKQ